MSASRQNIVSVRLTDRERDTLRRRAAAEGCTPSEYLRRLVTLPPPGDVLYGDTSAIAPGYAVVLPTPFSLSTPGVMWEDGTVGPTWHSRGWPGPALWGTP